MTQDKAPFRQQPRARFVVPAAAAILLTFSRAELLPFLPLYTWVDKSINIFVVVIAPWFALKDIYSHLLSRNIHLRLLFLMLVSWVSIIVLVGSPSQNWPGSTNLISLGLTILISSQISRFELCRLRHLILFLAGVFTVYAIIYARPVLQMIFSGKETTRLGEEVSAYNVIAFPRVMYTFIITCLFSLVVEKGFWSRIYSAVMMIMPIIIAFATGGRGPLVGFIAAVSVIILGLRKKHKVYVMLAFVGLATISYVAINTYFPVMEHRIMEGDDSGRSSIWTDVINRSITWFGYGIYRVYPHNIFLEFLIFYGVFGLIFFLMFFVTLVASFIRCFNRTRHDEVLWAISLFILQMIGQQFSLDIFFPQLWAAILLPLGFSWDCSPVQGAGVAAYSEAGSNSTTTLIKRNRYGHQGYLQDDRL